MSEIVTFYPLPSRQSPTSADHLRAHLALKAGRTLEKATVTGCALYRGQVTDGSETSISILRGYAYSTTTASLIEDIENVLPRKATNISVDIDFKFSGVKTTESSNEGLAEFVLAKANSLPPIGTTSTTLPSTTVKSFGMHWHTINQNTATVSMVSNASDKNTAMAGIEALLASYQYVWFAALNTASSSTYYAIGQLKIKMRVTYSLPEPQGVPISTKVGDEWYEGNILVKANGEWVDVPSAFVKLNGEWKEIGTFEE